MHIFYNSALIAYLHVYECPFDECPYDECLIVKCFVLRLKITFQISNAYPHD